MPGTVVAQVQELRMPANEHLRILNDDGSQEAAEEEVDTHLAGLEQGRD